MNIPTENTNIYNTDYIENFGTEPVACTWLTYSWNEGSKKIPKIYQTLITRDGNEYWKRYSFSLFKYSFFESEIGIRFQVNPNTITFPFPFSNKGNFQSISMSYYLRIYFMFSIDLTLYFSFNRCIWVSI